MLGEMTVPWAAWAVGAVCALAAAATAGADQPAEYDVVVYGGTSGGVIAAIQAAEMGKSVVLIEPTGRLGGMTTHGLSWTDFGSKDAIQGLSREYYERVGQEYGSGGAVWNFEPHVAERVFDDWAAAAGVTVLRNERLELDGGVSTAGGRVTEIRTESGKAFAGGVFIDAGYEGDLLAGAQVTYRVGREANSEYGEVYNGVQKARATKHQFSSSNPVDPYVVPGDPASGLLPLVSGDPPGTDGEGDDHVQAYNYRLIVTRAADRRPWTAPAGYDAGRYELLRRHIAATNPSSITSLMKLDGLRGGKYDMNNRGAVSTDYIGGSYDYPDANHLQREAIRQEHKDYQQGLLYYLATDPNVPRHLRDEMNSYGLTRDEFQDSNGWSGQIYVREARRMVGRYVMTDRNCLAGRDAPESIGLGSYNMDSHNTQRYVDPSGHARNEGDIQRSVPEPYEISYRSLTPQEAEASNLLVTSAVSASHIAYGSIRMEPVFMVLGQAAGTAAAMALDGNTSVQGVSYLQLRQRLIDDGALVEWPNNGVIHRGVVEADFNDWADLSDLDLQGLGGGAGFREAWGARHQHRTGTQRVRAGDLAYDRGGYAVAQRGDGSPGKVRGLYGQPRQNCRRLTGTMVGDVWFSLLVQADDATGVCGLTFNPTGNADPANDQVRNGVQLVGGELRVILDGQTTANVADLAVGQTHLLLGRMVLGDGRSRFELWADPNDLKALGPADFVDAETALFDGLDQIAVLSWDTDAGTDKPWTGDGGWIDAIRISNREGLGRAFRDVTGTDRYLPGDADIDGDVDAADYMRLKRALGTDANATWLEGDFDYDGDVDREDLRQLRENFGRSVGLLPPPAAGAPASVPEPGSLVLLAAGAGVTCARRRARCSRARRPAGRRGTSSSRRKAGSSP